MRRPGAQPLRRYLHGLWIRKEVSRPVASVTAGLNEREPREAATGARPVHEKHYLPDEAGYWEHTWYDRRR